MSHPEGWARVRRYFCQSGGIDWVMRLEFASLDSWQHDDMLHTLPGGGQMAAQYRQKDFT